MKRKLAVRVGAVITASMIALFTVLPEVVNAEGEENQSMPVEVTEETLLQGQPQEVPIEVPAQEQPQEPPVQEQPVEQPQEPSVQEQPVEQPQEPSVQEQPVEQPSQQITSSGQVIQMPTDALPEQSVEEVRVETPDEVPITVLPRGASGVEQTGTVPTEVVTGMTEVEMPAEEFPVTGEEGSSQTDGGNSNKGKKNRNKNKNKKNQKVVQSSSNDTSTVRAAAPAESTGTVAAISQNNNSHVKDATPKTGVEDYGVYFLLGAVMLLGASCFAYGQKLNCEE